jgi:hypothetical protein
MITVMRPMGTLIGAATLVILAGCATTERTMPEPSPAAKPITFGANGVAVKKPVDVRKLAGAPEDFQQFIAGRLDEAVSTRDPEFPECVPTVNVNVYDPTGFASGSRTDCGGYAIIWAKKGGVWQEVWGGQDLAACSELKALHVPPSVVPDQKCYAKGAQKAERYTG